MQARPRYPSSVGYPQVYRPPTASMMKTILFCISLVLSLGGAVVAVYYIPKAANDDYQTIRYEFYDYGSHYSFNRGARRDDLMFGLIPTVLQFAVFVTLGCLSCCCQFEKCIVPIYLSITFPMIGSAIMIGKIIDSIHSQYAPASLVGFVGIVVGNVLMVVVLCIRDTPLLLPMLSLREWGMDHRQMYGPRHVMTVPNMDGRYEPFVGYSTQMPQPQGMPLSKATTSA